MGISTSPEFQIQVVAATSLNGLVAGMTAGTMADFAINGLTFALLKTSAGKTSLAYTNKGYWDPFDRKAYHFGSGHNPERGVHIRYDDASNTMEDFDPPGVPPVQGPKHSYEHIAFQPRPGQKGVLYHWKKYSPIVERLDLETEEWDRIADVPGSRFQVAGGLEWFPELYDGIGGLVHVDSVAGVSTWHPLDNRWDEPGGRNDIDGIGPYHNFATYLPDQGVVLFGGGNNSTAVFEIDADRNIRRLGNSPYKIGVDRKGIFLAPPGMRPTLFSYDNKIWEYDYANDSWDQAGTHDLYTTVSTNWVAGISIDDYGCAVFLLEKNPPQVRVYKFRPV